MTELPIDYEQAEPLGISHEAYDEVVAIVGHLPTMSELSTLLAMWESNGKQQSLYGWLRGQQHSIERNDYLYTGGADHRSIREPKVKECLAIAKQLCNNIRPSSFNIQLTTGLLLYMVGNVSTEFADSEYARLCLHLVDAPMGASASESDLQYTSMILSALEAAGLCSRAVGVGEGGLFCSLLAGTVPLGFDILCPREVRLDAFLFGEEAGRSLVAVGEEHDDQFLLKLDEARLNCCFLGRTTKGRIVVDGYDFGPADQYTCTKEK